MRILLLVIVIILTSCNPSANGSTSKWSATDTDIPRLQRVWDEKHGVMCYFPMRQGTDIIVLEGMSCVQLEK